MNLIKWHGSRECYSKVWFIVLHTGVCFHVLFLQLGKACNGFLGYVDEINRMSAYGFLFEVCMLSAACKPSLLLCNGPWIILYLISISKPFCFPSHSATLPCITLFRVSCRKEIDVWRSDILMLNIYSCCCSVYVWTIIFECNSVSCFCPFVT